MNFQSLVDTSIGRSESFDLALASTALLGVGWWVGFSSHIFYNRPLARITSAHWVFFTRFVPTPWIFAFSGFSAVSDLYRLLSDMLHSWGSFDFSMSLKFLEWVTKLSANFSNYYHAICIFFTVQFPRGIRSCCRVFDHMNARLAAFFWGDLFCP